MTNDRLAMRFAAVTLAFGLSLTIAGCGQPLPLATTPNRSPAASDPPVVAPAPPQLSSPLAATTTPTAQPAVTLASEAPSSQPAGPGRTPLGPGFTNNFNHALVRTAEDRLYVLINNDTPAKIGAGPGYLAMLRATSTGSATGFEEQDAAQRPTSGASYLADASIAIDAQGLIHVLYHDRDGVQEQAGQLRYTTFDTQTNAWRAAEIVAEDMSDYERGYGGTAISLDHAGVPHVVYANRRQVFYRNREGGQWSGEFQLGDSPNESQHPSIAHGPDSRVHIAWHLRDPGNQILYRSRSAGGEFDPPQSIASYRRDTLNDVDQGPMLTLTADGTVWCAYLDGEEHTRVRRLAGDSWVDDGPPGKIYAHSPTIAAVNNDLWLLLGHDDQIDYALLHKPAGEPWSDKQTLEVGTFDGSANVRWSWFFNGSSSILDTLFFDEGQGSQLLATIFYRPIPTNDMQPTPEPSAEPTPEPSAAAYRTFTPVVAYPIELP